jgi:IclR family acetate operon transcriptional repressor
MWNVMDIIVEPTQKEESSVIRLVGSDRVLEVLRELARHSDGIGLDELARRVGSPKPTVHRALVALRRAGFAAQDNRGHYLLGDEFLRLAFAHHEARPDHVRIHPVLEVLSQRYRETVHYAVLDDRSVIYRSKVDPPSGAVKLSSSIGGRNPAHCTAVGKLLLAHVLTEDKAVRAWVRKEKLERRTDQTITTADRLCAELATIRTQGYATDNQENEQGVNCIALPVFLNSPTSPSGAISVSGLFYRTPLESLITDIPAIRLIIDHQLEGAS